MARPARSSRPTQDAHQAPSLPAWRPTLDRLRLVERLQLLATTVLGVGALLLAVVIAERMVTSVEHHQHTLALQSQIESVRYEGRLMRIEQLESRYVEDTGFVSPITGRIEALRNRVAALPPLHAPSNEAQLRNRRARRPQRLRGARRVSCRRAARGEPRRARPATSSHDRRSSGSSGISTGGSRRLARYTARQFDGTAPFVRRSAAILCGALAILILSPASSSRRCSTEPAGGSPTSSRAPTASCSASPRPTRSRHSTTAARFVRAPTPRYARRRRSTSRSASRFSTSTTSRRSTMPTATTSATVRSCSSPCCSPRARVPATGSHASAARSSAGSCPEPASRMARHGSSVPTIAWPRSQLNGIGKLTFSCGIAELRDRMGHRAAPPRSRRSALRGQGDRTQPDRRPARDPADPRDGGAHHARVIERMFAMSGVMAESGAERLRWRLTDDDGGQPELFDGVTTVPGTRELAGLEFMHVRAKRVINRVPDGSRMPFRYTVNPYRGCSHACVYCFARPTHEYLNLDRGPRLRHAHRGQGQRRRAGRGRARLTPLGARAGGPRHQHRPVPAVRGPLPAHARASSRRSPRRATRSRS